jgi:hypothetical protein
MNGSSSFQGFQFPTTTPVPDEVFDVLMPQLSGAELKVLLYICRRTFGFKKASDNISLQQIATGITTKDGRVLDRGTGLCIPSVTNSVRSLEQRGIIVREKNQSSEKGFEATTYSLKFVEGNSKNCISPTKKTEEALLQKMNIQQTVIQETEKQEAVVVDVHLQNFGIKKPTATRLAHDYPQNYIFEKLAMAQTLVAAGTCTNPAGWLRKAIEEDYEPPKIREKNREKKAQVKTAEEPVPDPVPVPDPLPIETNHQEEEQTTQIREVWQKVVERVKNNLPFGESENRMAETRLLRLSDSSAVIGCSTRSSLILERRFYEVISQSIKEIIGRMVDLQFYPLPSTSPELPPR